MPVRKVKLKDGSTGYQWGTTGKIYKKREDAEKQGLAILLSQIRKRKMKFNKELYNELKEKVDSLEKLINGGKGSGNFGHAGRPGERGGSAPEGTTSSKEDKYVPSPLSGLRDTGDSYWGDAKQGISLLDDSKKDMVELARRQYDEDHAKQIKTEIERTRELLTMLPEDWRVRIDRVSPGLLETKLATKYKIGDEFTIDGEIMKVVEGDKPGTIMGISEDKKRVVHVPDERLFELAKLESQTTLGKQNYEAIRKIAEGGRFNEKEAAERIIANIEEWSAKKHNSFIPRPEELVKTLNGGKGSGNFGHSGRPGERGGSAPAQTGVPVTAGKTGADLYRAIGESNQRIEEAKRHIDKIEHILGKKPQVDPELVGESSYIYFEQDGKNYSYEKRSETLREQSDDPMSRGKEILSPEEKKAEADEWEASWNVKGSDIKKKLKSYGLATDGLSVRRESGGYSDAWYISGSGSKLDLPMIEKIVKRKLEHYDVDERSGEILSGGNTFVFVRDTDKNMLYQKLSNKLDELALALNGRGDSN